MTRHRTPTMGRWPRAALLAVCALVLTAAARADEYRLGPQDKLRIKIVEWRPGSGQAVEWEALSDDYAVNASGRISMPMLGTFGADGLTIPELADMIGAEMQKRVGMPLRPEVSVEIQGYRPFYVLGAVEKPGDYAYRPSVTPLQAVGIAGGFYRPSDAGLLRIERDRITAQGLIEENRLDVLRGEVRQARLQAEFANRAPLKLPKELEGKPLGSLVEDEDAIAKSRTETFTAQIKAADGLKALLDDQIKSLDAKIASQNRQVDISRRELQSYTALTSQGLAISSRQFSLERSVSEDEGRKIDFEMAALTARQDRRKAEQSQIDLRNERVAKITSELADVRMAIAQARAKIAAQEALIREATVTTPALVLDRERAGSARRPVFILTRRDRTRDTASTTVVTDATVLEPGDVLQVEVAPLSDAAGEGRSLRSTDRRSAAE